MIHYIMHLAVESASNKEPFAINYKSELMSGIRLQPSYEYTKDGLIRYVHYSYQGKKVLRIHEEYQYNATDSLTSMPISKRGISSRMKYWHYYFEDGVLDLSDDEAGRTGLDRLTSKDKIKHYVTDIEGIQVGKKRRENIQIILSQRLGTALIILQITTDKTVARDMLRAFSGHHSSAFTEYLKYGTENIYTEIQEDTTNPWLSVRVPTNDEIDYGVSVGQFTLIQGETLKKYISLGGISTLQGLTLREYSIEKLKGNLI